MRGHPSEEALEGTSLPAELVDSGSRSAPPPIPEEVGEVVSRKTAPPLNTREEVDATMVEANALVVEDQGMRPSWLTRGGDSDHPNPYNIQLPSP